MTPAAPLVTPKWRPSVAQVVFGVVLTVGLLPVAGLLAVFGFEAVSGRAVQLRSVAGIASLFSATTLVASLIAYVALRTLLGPVQRLLARTDEIERGDPGAFRRLDGAGTREMAVLGERLVRLAKRLSDRSDYLALFSRHLSHELKSPLAAIRGAVELLRDEDMDAAQRERFVNNAIADTERLSALATRLRELAQADLASGHGACDLRAVAGDVVGRIDGLALSMEGDTTLPIPAEAAGIVLQQLAANAKEHGAGVFRLRTGGTVLIGDDGAAIPDANRAQLFEPFFTTRRDAGGTGLGLSIAAGMAASHGMALTGSAPPWKFELAEAGGR